MLLPKERTTDEDDRLTVIPEERESGDELAEGEETEEVEQAAMGHLQVLKTVFPGSRREKKLQKWRKVRRELRVATILQHGKESATPLTGARYFVPLQVGREQIAPLLDTGANVNLVNGHYLRGLEEQEGRFLRTPCPITVKDHSRKRLRTPEAVLIPVHLFGNVYLTPFLCHETEEPPNTNCERMLLGAPFVQGARLETVWSGDDLVLRAQGEDYATVTLVQEAAPQGKTSKSSMLAASRRITPHDGLINRVQIGKYKTGPDGQPVRLKAGEGQNGAPEGSASNGDAHAEENVRPEGAAEKAHLEEGAGEAGREGAAEKAHLEEGAGEAGREAAAVKARPEGAASKPYPERSGNIAGPVKTRHHSRQEAAEDEETKKKETEGVPPEHYEAVSPIPEIPKLLPSDWREIISLDTVDESRRPFLTQFMDKHKGILSLHAADVGRNNDDRYAFPIDVEPGFKMPRMRPYVTDPEDERFIDETVDKWLKIDVVEPSTGLGCFPIFTVDKSVPSGANAARELILKKRPVIDFRRLNAAMAIWPQKIPHLLSTLARLQGQVFLTKIDLANAYLNLTIRESDRHLTTFITPSHRLWQFKRMPFGLANAGSFFQFYLTDILQELQGQVVVYLDDILLFSKTAEEHEQLLDKFATIIGEKGLKISPKKCSFFQQEVEYLSFIVDGKGARISEEKVRAVKDFARPQTVKQTQGFLGLTNWLSRFIPRYQSLCAPLWEQTRHDVKFEWTPECETSFQALKKAIAEATMLHHPRFNETVHIYTDASKTAGGGGLFQVDEKAPQEVKESDDPSPEFLVPVAFHARKWNKSQSAYSTLEQEVLAILDALAAFKLYTRSAPRVILHTDARSALFLLSVNYHSDNSQLCRYSMRLLAEPRLTIVHCPGSKNALADALSRQWSQEEKKFTRKSPKKMDKEDVKWTPEKGTSWKLDDLVGLVEKDPLIVSQLSAITPEFVQEAAEDDGSYPVTDEAVARCAKISPFFRKYHHGYLAQAQANDEYCQKILQRIQVLPNQQDELFRFHHGLLTRKKDKTAAWDTGNMVVVVPRAMQSIALAYFHGLGHLGYKRLLQIAKQYYWWKGQRRMAQEFAQGCKVCQSLNRHKTGAQTTTNMREVSRPNEIWSIDFLTVGQTGEASQLLVIQDDFSGFTVPFPCSSQKTPQVLKALSLTFSILGPPKAIRSDHGRSLLEAKAVKTLCKEWGIRELLLGIPHIATKNARVERANQSIRGLLKALSEQYGTDFKSVLPLAAHAYNSTPHNLEGYSPYEIYTGRRVRLDLPTIEDDAGDIREHMTRLKRRSEDVRKAVYLMKERIRRSDLERLNRNKKELMFSEGDLVLLLDLSTPAAGDRPKKDRPTYLKSPFLIRRRLNNLCVLENLLDGRVVHGSVNHLKKLVPRGRVFQDLPAEFRRMFGHAFRPFQLLQDDISPEIREDFEDKRPEPTRAVTRQQAQAPAADPSTSQADPQPSTSAAPQSGDDPQPSTSRAQDDAQSESDSDEAESESDSSSSSDTEPDGADTDPNASDEEDQDPVPSTSTAPPPTGGNWRNRLRASRRAVAKAARRLLPERRKK